MLPAKRLLEVDVRPSKRTERSFCKEGSPWTKYRRFAKLGRSGTSVLAADPRAKWPCIVVVKELKHVASTRDLIEIIHPNIVRLEEAWMSKGTVYFIYERMDITLDRLQQFYQLGEQYISTICRAVCTYANSDTRPANRA